MLQSYNTTPFDISFCLVPIQSNAKVKGEQVYIQRCGMRRGFAEPVCARVWWWWWYGGSGRPNRMTEEGSEAPSQVNEMK